MLRRIFYFKVRPATPQAKVEELLGMIRAVPQEIPAVRRVSVGEAQPTGGQWSHVWDMELAAPLSVAAYLDHPYHMERLVPLFKRDTPDSTVEKLDYIHFEPLFAGAQKPEAKPLISRALAFRIGEGVAREKVVRLEALFWKMPEEIPGIANWSLGKATSHSMPTPWTHMWHLEFEQQAGLDEYNAHPFHRDVIGPHFVKDHAQRIVEQYTLASYVAGESYIRPA